MKLSDIKKQKQPVPFEVTINEVVIITGKCVPGLITESMLQGIVEAQSAMKDSGEMSPSDMVSVIGVQSEMVVQSVLEWDLELDSGEPFPITREAIAKIDAEILGAIFAAIMGAQRPNAKTAETS